MKISRGSLVIAVTLSLLILCSGCATQHGTAAVIPAGPSVVHPGGGNSIPAGPSVVPTKHFAGMP
jgi:hypothetical protein